MTADHMSRPMTLRKLLAAARREQSTVHQMHLQDGSRVTTTHSTGPATHELIALAPQLAAALIEARVALAIALEDLDEWVGCKDSLEKAGFNIYDTAVRADTTRATLASIDAIMEGLADG